MAVRKSDLAKKVESLQTALNKFLDSEGSDGNLLKANIQLSKEKEDLAGENEILTTKNIKLRRELKTANDSNITLTERVKALKEELKTYKESIGMIQQLKNNLESGLLKLDPSSKKSIAD